jgi:hypothetical protein
MASGGLTTSAPARAAIWRCAGAGIMWSSAVTKYKLGRDFQAGAVTNPA